MDPVNLVLPIPPEPPPILADLGVLGEEGRALDRGIRLMRFPSREGSVVRELREGAYFLILGGTAEWYRVALPGGEAGYIHFRHVEVPAPGYEGQAGIVDWNRYLPDFGDKQQSESLPQTPVSSRNSTEELLSTRAVAGRIS